MTTAARALASLTCALALALPPGARAADEPAATPPAPVALPLVPESAAVAPIEEVQVVGERPGPGLWQVRNGDRTLYVLGTYRPLPKKMTWRSTELESVLDRARLVIPENPKVDADLGLFSGIKLYMQWRRLRRNADDATLQQVLDPPTFARFEALRTAYAPRDTGMLKLRPVLAAAELWEKALSRTGLTLDIDVENAVLKRARAHKVRIAELTFRIEDPKGILNELGDVPREAEIVCMKATLDRIESDLEYSRALAEAWATGDVDAIRSKEVWLRQQACFAALTAGSRLDDLRQRFENVWYDAAVDALQTHEVTLAVTSVSRLLRPGGLLERLRARGYEIVEP